MQSRGSEIGKCKILNLSVKIELWQKRNGNIKEEGLSKAWEIFREGGRGRNGAEPAGAEFSERKEEREASERGEGVN